MNPHLCGTGHAAIEEIVLALDESTVGMMSPSAKFMNPLVCVRRVKLDGLVCAPLHRTGVRVSICMQMTTSFPLSHGQRYSTRLALSVVPMSSRDFRPLASTSLHIHHLLGTSSIRIRLAFDRFTGGRMAVSCFLAISRCCVISRRVPSNC